MEMTTKLFIFSILLVCANASRFNVKYLEPGEKISYHSEQKFGSFEPDLQIYCYRGQDQSLANVFQSAKFQFTFGSEDTPAQFEGDTPESVKEQYDNQRTIFSFSVLNTNRYDVISINPFNQTCVGIETMARYSVHLNVLRIDFRRIVLLVIGLLLFSNAKRLSQTPLFYYLSGITLGIFASFLVVVYFSSKLFPRKTMVYGMMIGGWTLGIYFIQMIVENLNVILVTYQVYVFYYVLITGFISFVICYRIGPPENERSKDLIKWLLQIVANIMVFHSSSYHEASVTIMIIIVSYYYFPISIARAIRGFWAKKFPPKPRLLTNEEFYEQGARETTKALEELKQFCSSPESKPWKMMTRLKNPHRFAEFIEGSSHLQDEEVLEYETSQITNDSDTETDDTDIDTDDESEAEIYN